MTTYIKNILTLGLGLCLTAVMSVVVADDIEVFTGSFEAPGNANVLFIIDTSGSMEEEVSFNGVYDPATTYAGSCVPGRLYWAYGSNTVPECTTNYWYEDTNFVCDRGQTNGLDEFGYYYDRYARWYDGGSNNNRYWRGMTTSDRDAILECEDDFGRHGDGSSNRDVYASNYSYGPFYDRRKRNRNIRWRNFDRLTFFTANYLNFYEATFSAPREKIEIVKDVTKEVLANVSGINVALMRFSSNSAGGMIIKEMAPLSTSLGALNTLIDDDLLTGGGTPLAESMYEAHQYFTGGAVDYGDSSTIEEPRGYWPYYEDVAYPSVPASISGSNYISPITESCQKNYIILLTDGEPQSDSGADSEIRSLLGADSSLCSGSSGGSSNNCLDHLVGYMANNDMSSAELLNQYIETHVIGFDIDNTLLQNTATAGKGDFYRADDYDQLYRALTNIIYEITQVDFSFVSPTVSVNTFNRLTHNNDVYFNLYRPTTNPLWPGNLKRYQIGYNEGEITILDATDNPAVNNETGTFRDDAKSVWTIGDPDGSSTIKGGLASRLTLGRNIYVNLDESKSLAHADNALHEDNTALTAGLLAVTAGEREDTIKWARGLNGDGSARQELGDALHSKPVIISYGGTIDDPDLTLFYTANSGFLHAIDVENGANEALDRFSIYNADFLDKIKVGKNNVASDPKLYTLDGNISSAILDDNGNGYLDGGSETAVVYHGLRRGGKAFYAYDVTDRDNPRLHFKKSKSDSDYAEMGETWSTLVPAKVKLNGVTKQVLFMSGGYDINQDDPMPSSSEDGEGRALYMIDADTGARLWWAANGDDYSGANLPLDDMDYSIPSDPALIDINSDGLTDRIYVGDMGGQIWRFDINFNNTGAANFAEGGVIAALGGADVADKRRFYYAPSVSQFSDEYLGNFLAIAIGSGHRARPLGVTGQLIDDKFFMIRDKNIFAPARDGGGNAVYTAVTQSDLHDITDDLNPTVAALNAKQGWYIDLESNEKVITRSITADGRIFFNSYTAGVTGDVTCDPSGGVGIGRSYIVGIGTGLPAQNGIPVDEDGDGIIDIPEIGESACNYRCSETTSPMPPDPIMVFVEPDPEGVSDCSGFAQVATVIGSQVSDPDICTAPIQTYWIEDSD